MKKFLLEDGSISLRALLAQEYSTLPDEISCEMTLPQGAHVQLLDDLSQHKLSLHLLLEQGSHLTYLCKMISPRQAEPEKHIEKKLTVSCRGRGAQADLSYLILGRGNETFSLTTVQGHQAPHSKSNLSIKGVFFDQARLITNNLIRIEKGADHVQAREENKNLLLGSRARVITIPKLEVHANEVHCQHGAAVSRIDEAQLFYLESRGLSHDQAQQLLIESFLH